MKWDDKDCIEVCSLSCIEYAEIYFYFLIYTEKILHNNGIRLDCCSKEEILRDALTEAFLLYLENEINITVGMYNIVVLSDSELLFKNSFIKIK